MVILGFVRDLASPWGEEGPLVEVEMICQSCQVVERRGVGCNQIRGGPICIDLERVWLGDIFHMNHPGRNHS